MTKSPKSTAKQPRGRPVTNRMPEPIPDTPENIARALLTTPPKKDGDWDYLNPHFPSIVDIQCGREGDSSIIIMKL